MMSALLGLFERLRSKPQRESRKDLLTMTKDLFLQGRARESSRRFWRDCILAYMIEIR